MPFVRPALSAPGVYVQEVPSGKHHITGVSTSVTAFLGRTSRGPVSKPTSVRSFGEFIKVFGGLSADSPMTYCLQDFFQNGGTEAIVTRLFEGNAAGSVATVGRGSHPVPDGPITAEAQAAKAKLDDLSKKLSGALSELASAQKNGAGDSKGASSKINNASKAVAAATAKVDEQKTILANLTGGVELNLIAANAGSWGNRLTYSTNTVGINESVTSRFATAAWDGQDIFNLVIHETLSNGKVATETYTNISLNANAGAQGLEHTLEVKSQMARLANGSQKANAGSDSGPLSVATYQDGLEGLKRVDIFNLLCVPTDTVDGDTEPSVYSAALSLCELRRATLVVDSPIAWEDDPSSVTGENFSTDLGIAQSATASRHAAVYFPRVMRPDPLRGNFSIRVPSCGAVAGTYSRTDASRGVWKAPAGLEAGLLGCDGASYALTDAENGLLNKQGVNCIRSFGSGPVLWGARTMRGSDQLSDEYQYIPVRRLADYIEETLQRNTRWAVFEPNDDPLWTNLRLTVNNFMRDLFRQGAFAGSGAADAFFVLCDSTTTSPEDIDAGLVNIVVGYAPLKPAEFVVLYLQQWPVGLENNYG
jgi:phage tail sheath protein FI